MTCSVCRALCKLKMSDFSGCLKDASVAVALDPTNTKAMHRRGMAKKGLGLLVVSSVYWGEGVSKPWSCASSPGAINTKAMHQGGIAKKLLGLLMVNSACVWGGSKPCALCLKPWGLGPHQHQGHALEGKRLGLLIVSIAAYIHICV